MEITTDDGVDNVAVHLMPLKKNLSHTSSHMHIPSLNKSNIVFHPSRTRLPPAEWCALLARTFTQFITTPITDNGGGKAARNAIN